MGFVVEGEAEAAPVYLANLSGCGDGSGPEGGGGGGFEVWYFTGDSFSRKSRRLGSRSRRGSLLVSFELPFLPEPPNQPIGSQRRQMQMLDVLLYELVMVLRNHGSYGSNARCSPPYRRSKRVQFSARRAKDLCSSVSCC